MRLNSTIDKVLFAVLPITGVLALGCQSAMADSHTGASPNMGIVSREFTTPQGHIKVNLPADLTSGDTISGTVLCDPAGKDADEQKKNRDELYAYVIEISKQKTNVGDKWGKWTVPAGAGAIDVILRDGKGKEFGKQSVDVCKLPVLANAVAGSKKLDGEALSQSETAPTKAQADAVASPSGRAFLCPVAGRSGRPLSIIGDFGGDLSATNIKFDGEAGPVLAESPRQVVVLTPRQETGPMQVEIIEAEEKSVAVPYRNIDCKLDITDSLMHPGDTTSLTLTMAGLKGLESPLDIEMRNNTAEIVSMSGGGVITWHVPPQNVQIDGSWANSVILTSIHPGEFFVTATILASTRSKFLQWWFDYCEAVDAYEMIDGYVTSPFHYPIELDRVSSTVHDQIKLLTKEAKKKLLKRLEDRSQAKRDEAKKFRAVGDTAKADRSDDQAKGFDKAAEEVKSALGSAAP